MALRIVRLFWWHAKQFACPHYQHSLPLSLALSLSLFYFPLLLCFYQKFVTLKNTQRQKTEPTEFTTMNQQFGAGQREPNAPRAPREREREQRTALPTPKEFRAAAASCRFGSARLALLLLLLLKFKDGNSGCWCSVLLSTSTRLDACSAGVSLAHSQVSSKTTLCVCVSLYSRVCVRLSLLRVSVPPMPQETLS